MLTEFVFGLILALAAAGYAVLPLWRLQSGPEQPGDGAEKEWEARKREALAAIKEAEFDLATGKMTAEDFAQIKGKYLALAARAEAALEQSRVRSSRVGDRAPVLRPRFCPLCGGAQPVSGRFCAHCGGSLAA